ncbi:DDE_Tnp_1_7 domain-containing protein [Trichonephila clavipes]|uniref:DDE_Tnp_1_7 domain-containing protein n=1 Tax=Trichonephila clavipes TaxID=2585209 RepID=A0A8X6VCK9_TRICX|nr:DDE_Tnp_1_7 domain-containing protein [Trichonephila clavipes]
MSSLSDEDDYQSDNGSKMDGADEDQDVTFDFSARTQWGIHTDKFNTVSFDFQEVGLPSHCKKLQQLHGGVDHLDRTFSFYRMKSQTKKWTVLIILHMIDFTILNIASTLIHGLLKKPSPTPSLAEDENEEPLPKLRLTTCIPHQAARNKEDRHTPSGVTYTLASWEPRALEGPQPDYRQVPTLCKIQLGGPKPDFAGGPKCSPLRHCTRLKWLGTGLIEVGAGIRSARP